MSAAPALAVRELRKSYGEVEAVAGISFTVEQGEVFGLLGPNGAGKTTTVEILEGYRTRDGGDVTVLGVDPEHGGSALRERIGVVRSYRRVAISRWSFVSGLAVGSWVCGLSQLRRARYTPDGAPVAPILRSCASTSAGMPRPSPGSPTSCAS